MASLKERHHDAPPLIVHWPLLYANKEFVGQGTLLNVSPWGCQVAGTMPVARGMVLKLWISPAHRGDALYVKEARVLWARSNEFGIELREVDVQDHQWLMNFFKECGHIFGQVARTYPEDGRASYIAPRFYGPEWSCPGGSMADDLT